VLEGEIARLVAGYAWAVETVAEVAAEGGEDARTELARHIMEVFDLYRTPLGRVWSELTEAQRRQVQNTDGELLAADKGVWDAAGILASVSDKPLSSKQARRRATDYEALEKRRAEAARLFAEGKSRAELARQLQVSRQTAGIWFRKWQAEGEAGLRVVGRGGRGSGGGGKPKVTATQLAEVEQQLLRGATAHGYPADFWTVRRIAEVISRLTGVRYSLGHVWIIMHRMGWSLQRPEDRAREEEEQVSQHRHKWRRLRRTWAPRG